MCKLDFRHSFCMLHNEILAQSESRNSFHTAHIMSSSPHRSLHLLCLGSHLLASHPQLYPSLSIMKGHVAICQTQRQQRLAVSFLSLPVFHTHTHSLILSISRTSSLSFLSIVYTQTKKHYMHTLSLLHRHHGDTCAVLFCFCAKS